MVDPTPTQGYLAALLASMLWIVGFVVVSALGFPRQDINA
jgi:ABC-2 type transport system permease protein